MKLDPQARYTESHEWVRKEGDDGVCGITDHAQESLSDVVYVEVPEVGDVFDRKDPFVVVESFKAASDLNMPKGQSGRDLCFQGGIDIQDVLPHGSPAEVRAHVADRARIMAPGGGYIFGTAHNLLPDVPSENIRALFDAYHEFGRYD